MPLFGKKKSAYDRDIVEPTPELVKVVEVTQPTAPTQPKKRNALKTIRNYGAAIAVSAAATGFIMSESGQETVDKISPWGSHTYLTEEDRARMESVKAEEKRVAVFNDKVHELRKSLKQYTPKEQEEMISDAMGITESIYLDEATGQGVVVKHSAVAENYFNGDEDAFENARKSALRGQYLSKIEKREQEVNQNKVSRIRFDERPATYEEIDAVRRSKPEQLTVPETSGDIVLDK